MLKHKSDLSLAHMSGRGIAAVEKHLTSVSGLQAGNDPQQGGFTTTGRSQQADQLAGRKIQCDIVKGDEITETLDDILYSYAHGGILI